MKQHQIKTKQQDMNSRHNRSISLILGLLIVLLTPGAIYAAPGQLDQTYANAGQINLTGPNAVVTDVMIDLQERSVWAGMVQDGQSTAIAIWRYNLDGTLDHSFGNEGMISYNFGVPVEQATALAIQPHDESIVVVGTSGDADNQRQFSRLSIIRLLATGELDPQFGAGGRTVLELGTGGREIPASVAILPDRDILVGGTIRFGEEYDFFVAKLKPDGRRDMEFGENGFALAELRSTGSRATAMAIAADGRIVIAGTTANATTSQLALARFTAGGRLDPEFNGGTSVQTTLLNNGTARALGHTVSIRPDGRIVVAGAVGEDVLSSDPFIINYRPVVARYRNDGTLDTQFGIGGFITLPIIDLLNQPTRANDYAGVITDLRQRPDGRLIVGVVTENLTRTEIPDPDDPTLDPEIVWSVSQRQSHLAMLDAIGSRYTPFGTERGIEPVNFREGQTIINRLDIQLDGSILVAGNRQGWPLTNNPSLALPNTDVGSGQRFTGESFLTLPASILFNPAGRVRPETRQTSESVSVDALDFNVFVPVWVTGGELSVDDGETFHTHGAWVRNGDRIQVRHRSAAEDGGITRTSIQVGGIVNSRNPALIRGRKVNASFSSEADSSLIPVPEPPPPEPQPPREPGAGAFGPGLLGILALLAWAGSQARKKRAMLARIRPS